jgi:hypothetical protein
MSEKTPQIDATILAAAQGTMGRLPDLDGLRLVEWEASTSDRA